MAVEVLKLDLKLVVSAYGTSTRRGYQAATPMANTQMILPILNLPATNADGILSLIVTRTHATLQAGLMRQLHFVH